MTTAELNTPVGVTRGSDFAELSRRVKQAGLLNRHPAYYTLKIAMNAVLLGAGCLAFVLVGDSWWSLLLAGYLAVAFTQVAFMGHDAGHKQIFRTGRASDVLGLLHGNLVLGMSYGWWVDKHNRHHAHPNDVGKDPDVAPGALVYTADEASRRRGFGRLITLNQAYLFFPMLLLEALSLRVTSIQMLTRRTGRGQAYRRTELLLILFNTVGYLAAVFLVLSPLKALVFVVVHQGLFGLYLGMSFAPNHKGMPMLTADEARDFLRRQVLTSRNVRGSRLTDFVLGGLNYQIEHHLFPNMPRPSLRRAQRVVRGFCAERGIRYVETSALASYVQVLRHLHSVGETTMRTQPAT